MKKGERMRTDVVRRGRLFGREEPGLQEFLSSMDADRRIAKADLLVDIAHVLMLDRQKINERKTTKQILNILLKLDDSELPEEVFDPRFEDVHAGIESLVIEAAGSEAGGRMHMARSRNDEVATCIRLTLRMALLLQMKTINELRLTLLSLAAKHTDSIM
ncbi:MAG: argininosuccinate lyase, partial [Methanoregula sp.]